MPICIIGYGVQEGDIFMIDLNEVVDVSSLAFHYIVRKGFVFTSITFPANIYDAIVIRNPIEVKTHLAIKHIPSKKTLTEYIKFINDNQIEKAEIISDEISFIKQCQSLKYISVIPSNDIGSNFDYSPLYELPEVRHIDCFTRYGNNDEYTTSIDCSKIKGLLSLCVSGNGYLNYNKINTLRSLMLSNIKSDTSDLRGVFCSRVLDTLQVTQCVVKSLNGIEQSEKMQCLYLLLQTEKSVI